MVFARGGERLEIFVSLSLSCIPYYKHTCKHMHLRFQKYAQTSKLHIQLEMTKVLELGGSLAVKSGLTYHDPKDYYAASNTFEWIGSICV